jgi:hypothetical protein
MLRPTSLTPFFCPLLKAFLVKPHRIIPPSSSHTRTKMVLIPPSSPGYMNSLSSLLLVCLPRAFLLLSRSLSLLYLLSRIQFFPHSLSLSLSLSIPVPSHFGYHHNMSIPPPAPSPVIRLVSLAFYLPAVQSSLRVQTHVYTHLYTSAISLIFLSLYPSLPSFAV